MKLKLSNKRPSLPRKRFKIWTVPQWSLKANNAQLKQQSRLWLPMTLRSKLPRHSWPAGSRRTLSPLLALRRNKSALESIKRPVLADTCPKHLSLRLSPSSTHRKIRLSVLKTTAVRCSRSRRAAPQVTTSLPCLWCTPPLQHSTTTTLAITLISNGLPCNSSTWWPSRASMAFPNPTSTRVTASIVRLTCRVNTPQTPPDTQI